MVKVCHLSTVHQRFDTRIMLKECVSLVDAGYDVHLVIADNKGDEIMHGVKVHGLSKHTNRFFRMLLDPVTIWRKAISINASIYHFHDGELMFVGLFLRLFGKKVIYDVHDDLAKQIKGKFYIAPGLRSLLADLVIRAESFTCRRFTGIITAVTYMNERFSQYNSRVVTIHNYPLLQEVARADETKREQGLVCYVGGITKIRGIIEQMKAMEQVDARLLIAGKFDPPSLEAEARALPGWNKVENLGFLDRSQVAALMSRASLGILTLLPYENHLDSLPIKMMEYLGFGLPVVVSDFPNWRELLGPLDCAEFVDPLNPDSIASGIERLLADPVRCQEMGKRGRQAVLEKYNWQLESKHLLDLYKDIRKL